MLKFNIQEKVYFKNKAEVKAYADKIKLREYIVNRRYVYE